MTPSAALGGTAARLVVPGGNPVDVTWDEALVRYPAQSLLVMAAGMTVPMLAWMRYRGHSWHSCAEMAAAMVVPVIPFLCLVWFGVTSSAPCGPYCAVTLLAMLGVMVYRRDEYGMRQRHPKAITAAGKLIADRCCGHGEQRLTGSRLLAR